MSRQTIEVFLSAKAQECASSKSFIVGVRNAAGDQPAEIAIYGEIGDPWQATDSRSVGQFLRDNRGKPVCVRINSPGGLAYDGITIHNALLGHDARVTTCVEGLAGSAASIIAMAGSTVQMYENANLFIHRASVVAIGNADMMDEAKDWLTRLDDAIARTYKAKTGKAMDKILALMKGKVDGTVFTAKEALDGKWIDEIVSLKRGDKQSRALSPAAADAALRADAESRLNGIEAARAERIRSRREMFAPAE